MTPRLPPTFFTPPHLLSHRKPQTPILIGYSGGADSGALLACLALYAESNKTPLLAVHIHHGIRGREADRDLALCRENAARYGVPFLAVFRDVPTLRLPNESIETAARRVRYAAFAEVMRERKIPLLATAHQADDNLETVLFHLARGSGLAGLCGIPSTRRMEAGVVIRPLLHASKKALEDFCKEIDLSVAVDSTNSDTVYSRNRLRSDAVPVLRSLFAHPEIAVMRQSESLREDLDCLTRAAASMVGERKSLPLSEIRAAHPAIAKRALLILVGRAQNNPAPSLSHALQTSLLSFVRRGSPHTALALPGGLWAVIEKEDIAFSFAPDPKKKETPPAPYMVRLCQGLAVCDEAGVAVAVGEQAAEILRQGETGVLHGVFSRPGKNIYNLSIKAEAKSDTIVRSLFIRPRQAGDSIYMGGMHRLLKKCYCDAHLSPTLRARLPLLCDETGVLWAPGIGLCDRLKPAPGEPTQPLFFYISENL